MNQPDISSVTRKKAFWGKLTSKIPEAAWHLCSDEQGSILDVACGNGLFFTTWDSIHSAKLIRLDQSDDLLQEALAVFRDNNINNVTLVQDDAFQLPFNKHSFTVVLSLNTLYNLESFDDVKHVIKEMMAVCRPNGRIIFDIRNKANPYILLKYWWHRRKKTFPAYAYHQKDVRLFLEAHDCTVRRTIPVGLTWR